MRTGTKRSASSVVVVVAVSIVAWLLRDFLPPRSESPDDARSTAVIEPAASGTTSAVADAFRQESSGVMLDAAGEVTKTLPDDRDGSRHQRFIMRLADGHTVLIAHNIDLAPRVPLDAGDQVRLRGQYEWNEQGGVIHWTHHDPDGRHAAGWIEHAGQRYD